MVKKSLDIIGNVLNFECQWLHATLCKSGLQNNKCIVAENNVHGGESILLTLQATFP
jgi:hypothetical protein